MGVLTLDEKTLKAFSDYLAFYKDSCSEHKAFPQNHPFLKNLMGFLGLNLDDTFFIQSKAGLDKNTAEKTLLSFKDLVTAGGYNDQSKVTILGDYGKIIAGRSNAAEDWTLYDKCTSRRQALIEKDRQGVYVTDMGSSNGTFINSEILREVEKTKLPDGCTLHFGKNLGFQFYESITTFYTFLHLYARTKGLLNK